MSRRNLLALGGGIAGSLLLPRWTWADSTYQDASAPTPFDTDPLKFLPITDKVGVLTGAGGNIGVVTSDEGVLTIDTGVPSRGASILKAASNYGKAPVRLLVNTHYHFDHTGTNVHFGKAHIPILAHEKTRDRLSKDQFLEPLGFTQKALPKEGLPSVTFKDEMSIHWGDETLNLTYAANAHTDTDIIIRLEQANVVHMGDLFFNGMYPVIDYTTNGWIGGMVDGLRKGAALCGADTKVIPGHGAIGSAKELLASASMLEDVQGKMTDLIKAGKSADEIVAAKPTATYDAEFGKGLVPPDMFVKVAAKGLAKHLSGSL